MTTKIAMLIYVMVNRIIKKLKKVFGVKNVAAAGQSLEGMINNCSNTVSFANAFDDDDLVVETKVVSEEYVAAVCPRAIENAKRNQK